MPTLILSGSIPRGSNSQGSQKSFDFRKYYKNRYYPNYLNNDIDVWYEDPFYGIVDHGNNVVHPSETYLSLTFNSDNIFALNFVTDQFRDLVKYVKGKIANNALNGNSRFTSLSNWEPKSGWVNVNQLYYKHMLNIFSSFRNGYIPLRGAKFENFSEFFGFFQDYVDTFGFGLVLTREAFTVSTVCPLEVSGICLKLQLDQHSEDRSKSLWIRDPNYTFYTNVVKSFGFTVDKNAPWRLVADLSSQQMADSMLKYEISLDNVFEKYYNLSHQTDLENLKIYLTQFYNTIVSNKPFESFSEIDECGKLRIKLSKRTVVNSVNGVSNLHWLRLYMQIRFKELNKDVQKSTFNKLFRNVNDVYKAFGESEALAYINTVVKRL